MRNEDKTGGRPKGELTETRERLDRLEKLVDREIRLVDEACPSHGNEPQLSPRDGAEQTGPCLETLLVVDDDRAFREFVAGALERCGYGVCKAEGPEDALVMIQENPGVFPLVLVDIMLPGSSGRDLVRKIHAKEPGIKILYMSGYAREDIIPDDVYDVLEGGAVLLQKPFSPEELLKEVRLKLSEG